MKIQLFLVALILSVQLSFQISTALAHQHIQAHDGKMIHIKTKELKKTTEWLLQNDFDVAGVDHDESVVSVIVSQFDTNAISALKRKNFLIISEENLAPLAPSSEYKNPSEIEAIVKSWATRFPQLVQLQEIGRSVENRPIWSVSITSRARNSNAKPHVLFNGMHHAREVMTPEVVIDIGETLLNGYTKNDSKIKNWLDQMIVVLVPMLNVDGNNRVWNENSMWRKNTRDGFGVDINRNYPHRWGECNGSSGSTSSDTYRGPAAASEPETRVMMDLVARTKPVYSISFHSFSELVLYPFSCDGERVPNANLVEGIGKQLGNLLPKDGFFGGTYKAGTSWEVLYGVDGGDIDWMYQAHGVIPFVIEVNSRSEGFQPSYSQWRDKTVQKMRPAWQHLMNLATKKGIQGNVNALGLKSRSSVKVFNTQGKIVRTLEPRADGFFQIALENGTYVIEGKKYVVQEDSLTRL